MRSCNFAILASLCLAAFVLTGCQSSGIAMPKLAFWKQNDQLAAEDIEPPSHKLSPTRTGSDRVAHVDAGDGPPKRPEKKEVAPPSMDEFRAEVNRSWEQLAEKTRDATEDATRDVSAAAMDLANVETSPAVPNRGALAPAVSSSGSSSAGAENPSRPLFPSYDAAVAAQGSGSTGGSPAGSSAPGSGFRPSGGGFQPSPSSSGGTGGFGGSAALADSGNTASSSSGGTFRPQTNYEKIANAQFGGTGSSLPSSAAPTQNNAIASSSTGGFQPTSSPLAPAPQSTPPMGLQPRMGSADVADATNRSTPGSQLPSMPPLNTTPQTVAGSGEAMAGAGGFAANPGGSSPYPSQSQSDPVSQYAATPYQPFGSTQPVSGVATHSGTNTASPISSSLNLTGLGNYAPGSVQRPTPTQTAQSPSSSNNGGSFKR